MGLLRVFLALSVFFAHTAFKQITFFIDSEYAVEIFFMINGFLFSYVLINNKKYKTNYLNFYINRFIKIYPIYYIILFLTLFFFAINNDTFTYKVYFLEMFSNATASVKLFIVFVNTFLLGIDYPLL